MSPKTSCFSFLVGFAMILCTLADYDCPEVNNFETQYNISSLSGTWYSQGLYVSHSGLSNVVYCYKANNEIKNDELVMTSKVNAYCESNIYTTVIRHVPDISTGTLKQYRGTDDEHATCFFIAADGQEHLALYCCGGCKEDFCEHLFFYTRRDVLDSEVVAKMAKKVKDAGLQDRLPKMLYVSGNACFSGE